MLSFDPRALLAPGGVINGAGNAIAALANVPANARRQQIAAQQQQLAVQALAFKQKQEQDEFGLKQGAQQYAQNPNNPQNAHLHALDANMQPPMTFEQRLQLAHARNPAHQGGLKLVNDGFGGQVIFDPSTGQVQSHRNDYTGKSYGGSPAVQALAPGQAPADPGAAQTQGAPQNPVQALTPVTPVMPQVPRAGIAHPDQGAPEARIARLQELLNKIDQGKASAAEQDEFERLTAGMPGVDENAAPQEP